MKIAIDFDGTCVAYDFQGIGEDIGAVKVILDLVKAKHLIILNTMRSGASLEEAVGWFDRNGIPLYGVNEDPKQKQWTNSPKVFADLYIDDAALGCPIKSDLEKSKKPFVDWIRVREILTLMGLLPEVP